MSSEENTKKLLRLLSIFATGISIILNLFSYFSKSPIYAVISIIFLLIVLYYISRPVYVVVPRYQFNWNNMMMTLQTIKTTIIDEEFKKIVVEYLRTLSHCATIDGMNELAEQFQEEAERLETSKK
jgi:hypothetical protein